MGISYVVAGPHVNSAQSCVVGRERPAFFLPTGDVIMREKKLERLPAVLGRTGECKAGWYDKVRRRIAPQPVKLGGGRASAWVSSEVDDYIDAQIAARDAANGETP